MVGREAKDLDGPPIGRILDDRYRVEAEIGAGGVGAVYRATHLKLGQTVAIKLLLEHYGGHPALRKRFEREAKALASLAHPNIVAVTDYGVSGDTPYLVMELLEGMTLSQRLKQGRLPESEALSLTRSLLRALSFVHERGLVHRDLKPGNIFLQQLPDGEMRLKLLDFGLAKFMEKEPNSPDATLTRSGDVVGTPAYMAPEQVVGDATDARTDIYAVGIIVFAMLAGRLPFLGDPTDQLRSHLVEPMPALASVDPLLQVEPALEAFLKRATSKSRDERFTDAAQMLRALDELPQPWVRPASKMPTHAHNTLAVAATIADTRDEELATHVVDKSAPALESAALRGQERKTQDLQSQDLQSQDLQSHPQDQDLQSQGLPRQVPREQPLAGAAEQPELRDAAQTTSSTPRPAGWLQRTFAAGARWLIGASLVVILAAGALIYVLTSPERTQQRTQLKTLSERMGPKLQAIAAAAGTAKTEAEAALAGPAPGQEPSQPDPATEPATENAGRGAAEPVTDTSAGVRAAAPPSAASNKPRPPARNPWARGTPRELRTLRKALARGERGSERAISLLRKYNRDHADDPRGHLLLAQLYGNRGWRSDVVNQFETAYQRDPAARGAPEMLSALIALVAQGSVAKEAGSLLRRAYGHEASAALERAASSRRHSAQARQRLSALRARLSD